MALERRGKINRSTRIAGKFIHRESQESHCKFGPKGRKASFYSRTRRCRRRTSGRLGDTNGVHLTRNVISPNMQNFPQDAIFPPTWQKFPQHARFPPTCENRAILRGRGSCIAATSESSRVVDSSNL